MLPFLFLLFSLFSSLLADQLTTDPRIIWDTECVPCTPPACCPAPCLPILDRRREEEEVVLDLINPLYEDGVISTTEGGVLVGPRVRVQARKIVYTRQIDRVPMVFSVWCEGDLVVDYKDRVLTGETLYYDFISHTGRITCGKTAAFPWFIGGEEVLLCENGNVVIHGGYVTTSEGGEKDVMVISPEITVTPNQILSAQDVTFRIKGVPLLWIPKGGIDLKATKDSPFAFNFGWNGFLGTHLGVKYHFLTVGDFKGYARADGYFGRGLGVGFESEYDPKCSPTEFYTRNYYAHDLSIDDPEKKDRYRIQGTYFSKFLQDRLSCQFLYDFVSDAQMAADYVTHDFELNPAHRTEFNLRRQEESWIANLFVRAKVNSFQTINQELPSFEMDFHPFEIFQTGVIFDNAFRISYQDYSFSDDVIGAKNFSSGRFEVHPRLYRPIAFSTLKITPEARFIGIAYSDSPSRKAVGQTAADFGCLVDTTLCRFYRGIKHTAIPYVDYHYITSPRAPLDRHFLFTIEDAYAHLNLLRFGMRHLFFFPPQTCCLSPLRLDIWTNAFFETKNVPVVFQKGYLMADWQPHPRLLLGLETAWNFQDHLLDFFNTRAEWTISERLACAVEYRQRSSYAWRKNDFYNFLLESVRSEESLLASPLSDRRNTILGRLFYTITPWTAARFEIRHGWNRVNQPNYFEYHLQFQTLLFQHWRLLFSYEKREEDNRYSVALKLDPGPPSRKKGLCFR